MSEVHANSAVSPNWWEHPFYHRLRQFEKRLQADMANIHCPTHLCLGQEEVPVELYQHLRPQDWVFSTHRAHGHYLAKGGSEQKLWDEIHGLPTGINGGFSGSQGFSDAKLNFYCSAIVGGLVGTAAGVAWALKHNGSDGIVVCITGDGGTEAGVFWETINWAALHKLPIVFICENNGMSVDAKIEERQALKNISERVHAFGVRTAYSTRGAIHWVRTMDTPSFYEAHVKLECDHLNMSVMLPTAMTQ
jgi:TPP-dependent pyruvate/acetoin dehydrogenase alpha subunit